MLGSARAAAPADSILNPFFFHHHHHHHPHQQQQLLQQQQQQHPPCFEAKQEVGIWEFDHHLAQEHHHHQQRQQQQQLEPTSVLDLWSPSPSSRGAGSGLSLGGVPRHSHGSAAGGGGAANRVSGAATGGGGGSPCSYDDNHSNTSVGDVKLSSDSSGSSSSRNAWGGESSNADHPQPTPPPPPPQQQQNQPWLRDRSLDEWIADLQQTQAQQQQVHQNHHPQQQQQGMHYGSVEELETLLLKCPSSPAAPAPQEPHAFAKWFLNEQQNQPQQQQQQPQAVFAAKEECLGLDDSEFGYPRSGSVYKPELGQGPPFRTPASSFKQEFLYNPSFEQQQPAAYPQNLQLGAQLRKVTAATPLGGSQGRHLQPPPPPSFGEAWGGKRRAPPSLDDTLQFHHHHPEHILLDDGVPWSGPAPRPLLGPDSGFGGTTAWRNNNMKLAVPLVAGEECFAPSRKLQRVHVRPDAPPPLLEEHHQQQQLQQGMMMFSAMFGSFPSGPGSGSGSGSVQMHGAIPGGISGSTMGMNVHHIPPPSGCMSVTTSSTPSSVPTASSAPTSGNNNNNNNSVPDEGLGLMDQLVHLAQAIDVGSIHDAQSILARLNQHLFCHQGKRIQRLSFYFKEALAARLKNGGGGSGGERCNRSSSSNSSSSEHEETSSGSAAAAAASGGGGSAARKKHDSPLEFFHKVKAYMSFCEVSPLLKFAYLTANQAILEAAASGGATTLHIVDYDPGFGSQWASLLQDVANQRGTTTTRLRFTMVGPDETRLRFVVESLQDFARGLHMVPAPEVKLVVGSGTDGLSPAALDVTDGEMVAVNFMFSLHRALATSGGVSEVVSAAAGLSPAVVTLAEQEVDDNAAGFQKRFAEALQYYAFVMDSLGPDDGASVLAVERELLAPDIANAVSAEGRRRTERHERLAQWRPRMVGGGLQAAPLSEAARMQAEYLIKTAPSRNFDVVKDEAAGGLLLGWQGKPLVAVSAWTSGSSGAVAGGGGGGGGGGSAATAASGASAGSLLQQAAHQDPSAATSNKNTC